MTHEQHQNVSSLVSDLVQMAEATRRLPEVERQLADMRETARRDGDTIARLEIKLQQRSQELDALHAKLRSVEAERDDAGFRELEAQDKVNALRDAVEGVLSSFGETLGVVDGTDRIRTVRMTEASRKEFLEWKARKEEEDRQAEEAKREAERQSAADPTNHARTGDELSERTSVTSSATTDASSDTGQSDPRPSDGPSVSVETDQSKPIDNISEAGQSDPLPIALMDIPSPNAQSEAASNLSDASSQGSSSGRYSGKKYRDHPYYVSEASWLANGGTLEDYYYPQAIPAA